MKHFLAALLLHLFFFLFPSILHVGRHSRIAGGFGKIWSGTGGEDVGGEERKYRLKTAEPLSDI